MICALIYIFFLKNIFFLLKIFCYQSIDQIILYIYNIYDVAKSIFVVFFFFSYYIIYLRAMSFFIVRTYKINIFSIKEQFLLYCDRNNFLILKCLVLIMLGYLIFYVIHFMLFFFAKKHFLKLHYYYFRRSKLYNFILSSLLDFELLLSKKLKNKYKFFLFFEYNFFKLVIFFFFFKAIIVNSGDLNEFLLLMPYYSVYYFFLNLKDYILYKFKHDFEILVMESYYKNIFFSMELNEEKKLEYIKFLLLNYSVYKFEDSVYLDYIEYIKREFLMINTYKTTFNKKPNDFFTRIYKVKPQFLET